VRLAGRRGVLNRGSGDGSDAGGDGGSGEARRDGVGNFERRCAGGHFANGPVGQVYGDHVRAHMSGEFRCGLEMNKMRPTFEDRGLTARSRGRDSDDGEVMRVGSFGLGWVARYGLPQIDAKIRPKKRKRTRFTPDCAQERSQP